MITAPDFELPPDKEEKLERAIKLEWVTIGFMLSIIAVMYFTMGSSQAMKTAWIEDILTLVPPIGFLIAERFRHRRPNRQFPWGYHRAALVAFLAGATALALLGSYMLYDAIQKLILAEHPTIGLINVLGHNIWQGWLMIVALAYSAVAPVILGHMKLPLAKELHEKTLHTDAAMNKADWMTAVAGIIGIIGIGLGWWWADSAAAGFIAFDITRDGWKNLRSSIEDLCDQIPTKLDSDDPDPVIEKLQQRLEELDWVHRADIRLREQGRVLTGEIAIMPWHEDDLLQHLEDAKKVATDVDWRLHDLSVVPMKNLIDS